jgi:hypothetical protein
MEERKRGCKRRRENGRGKGRKGWKRIERMKEEKRGRKRKRKDGGKERMEEENEDVRGKERTEEEKGGWKRKREDGIGKERM